MLRLRVAQLRGLAEVDDVAGSNAEGEQEAYDQRGRPSDQSVIAFDRAQTLFQLALGVIDLGVEAFEGQELRGDRRDQL